MKKVTAAIIALVMVMGLCGCNILVDKPENVVDEFMDAMKNGNEDVLILYTENKDINTLIHNTADEKQMTAIYESLMKNFSWEIKSVKEDKEAGTAVVKVKISNSDFSNVLATYQTEAVKYTKDNLQQDSFTKEVMTEECMKIFVQHVKAAAKEDTVNSQTVTIELVQNDNHSWDMALTDEVMSAVLGGIQFPL